MSIEEPIKMLSLDDKSLTTSLDRAGYREMGVFVSSAATSLEAFEVLRNKHIDVMVINLDYRSIDAEAVCKHIRSNSQWKDLPIVITSVQAKVNYRKAALEAGANLYVEQPIPRTYFIEKLKQLLTKETRGNGRVSSEVLGKVKVTIEEKELEFTISDLSLTGILIGTTTELSLGSLLTMEFQIPGSKKPLKVEGEVVRLVAPTSRHPERPHGVGVRFLKFTGDAEKRLVKYLTGAKLDSKEMLYYL